MVEPPPAGAAAPPIAAKSIEDPLPFVVPGQWSAKEKRCRADLLVPLPNAYRLQSAEKEAEPSEHRSGIAAVV
jgi:hypothetical protein